jgi:hypothetical protein
MNIGEMGESEHGARGSFRIRCPTP